MEVIARKNGSYTGYTILSFAIAIAGVLGSIIGIVLLPLIWYVFLVPLLLPAIGIPVGIDCAKK